MTIFHSIKSIFDTDDDNFIFSLQTAVYYLH